VQYLLQLNFSGDIQYVDQYCVVAQHYFKLGHQSCIKVNFEFLFQSQACVQAFDMALNLWLLTKAAATLLLV